MDVTPDSIYQLLKSYEGQFQPPVPYFTINVGTLDVDTGVFTGFKTTSETDPEPIEHGPHDKPKNPAPRYIGETWVSVVINAQWRRTITSTPAPKAPLQPVLLLFSISHPISDPWSISVNGETLTAAPGETSLRADIWDSEIANWTLQAGSTSYKDTIRVQHPGLVPVDGSVGAFTIPALPVAIVYAPPVDSLHLSTTTYTQGQTVGNTITLNSSTDTSQTVPGQIVGTGAFKFFLDTTADVLTKGGHPAAAKAFSIVSSQVGEISSSVTNGISDQTELSMTVTETTSAALSTSAAVGGPGTGDLFYYLHSIKMAWGYSQGGLRLCPLGFQQAAFPVTALQQQLLTVGLSPQDAQAILALDPFVAGGPSAALPTDRFVQRTTWEYGFGITVHVTDSVTRDTKFQTTHTTYNTTTEAWDAGPILKGLGFGGSSTTTIKVSNATGSDVSTTITLDANLVSGPNDHFVVNLWYDKLFGAFAFQVEQPSATARFRGQGAQPHEEVRLMIGDKVFATVADQNGAFAFFAKAIPAGQAVLKIGSGSGKAVVIGD